MRNAVTTSMGTRWERFFDVVAAATSLGPLAYLFTSASPWGAREWGAAALFLASAALVACRRAAPRLTAIGAVAVSGVVLLLPDYAVVVWVLAEIVLFSLAMRADRSWTVGIGATHGVLLYVGAIMAFRVAPYEPVALILPVWTGAVIAFGTALRTQQEYVAAVEDRARTAVAAREVDLKRRLGEERLRIARDLHDSVANALTVISLQASKAQRHLGDESTRTEDALRVVGEVSRQTVKELAGILSVLRDNDTVEDHSLPSAGNIPHLIELFTATGAHVDADLSTLADLDLPPASSTALYRIAQEALTNAQRHGAAPVTLRAGNADDMAWLEVRNALRSPPRATESGFGLEGMRERAALAGGRFSAETTGAQFTVRVEVPAGQERV